MTGDKNRQNVVHIALFLSFEVDKVPQVIAESPTLEGALPVEDARAILRVAGRLVGQNLVALVESDQGAEAGSNGQGA